MTSPSVTYTFVAGNVASASHVNTNFSEIIGALTDSTKSLAIDALTCAGAATFNGAVTLGNATGDDITVTGYLASSLIPKTDASPYLGGAANSWAGLYLGGNSNQVLVKASATTSGDYTFTLPVSGGTANYVLMTDGAGVTRWAKWDTAAWEAGAASGGIVSTGAQTLAGAKTFSSVVYGVGATSANTQTTPALSCRATVSGNCLEWGHSNTGGYGNVLGFQTSGGAGFIGLCCESDAGNANKFTTRGRKGYVILSDNTGLFFKTVDNANATNQDATTQLSMSDSGVFTFADDTDATATNAASVVLAGGLATAKKIISGDVVYCREGVGVSSAGGYTTDYISLNDDAQKVIAFDGPGGIAVVATTGGAAAIFHVAGNSLVYLMSDYSASYDDTNTDGKVCLIAGSQSITLLNRFGSALNFRVILLGGFAVTSIT